MLMSNEKMNIRWDISYELDSSSTVRADRSICDSIIVEKDQARDFLKTIEIEDKKRHQSSKLGLRPPSPLAKKSSTLSYRGKDLDGYYFSAKKLQIPRNITSLLQSNYRCADLASSNLFDRIYGAFFGFLIGDSVGSEIAFQQSGLDELVLQSLLMNGGGTYGVNPGQATDDSEIVFALAYGLIESAGTYNQDIVAKHYGLWLKSRPFDISALVAIVLNGLRNETLEPDMSAEQVRGISTKLRKLAQKNTNQESNVGLVRILPLAIWSMNLTTYEIDEVVRRTSLSNSDEMHLIDANPLVIETALIWVKTLHLLFSKGDHEEAFYLVAKSIYDSGSEQMKALWQVVEKGHIISSKGNLGRLKTSFTYSFIQLNQPTLNFTETLIEVLRKGGDTDSNAAIVCSLIGAAVGYSGIPSYFRHRILNANVEYGKVRPPEYTPNKVVDIVRKLVEVAPSSLQLT